MKNLLSSLAFAGGLLVAPLVNAEEITLNAVSLTPKTHGLSQGVQTFVSEINEEFKGELQINWRGGPEVIQMFGQPDAVRNGAVDIAFTDPSFYYSLVPAAKTRFYTNSNYAQINESGYLDRLAELHSGSGLAFVGMVPASDVKFYFYLRDPIESVEELEGRRIRVFPTVQPVAEALGASPLVLPISEIYTAMERGAIDGFVFGPMGLGDQYEGLINQIVAPGFYQGGFNIIANEGVWNDLPEDLRERVVAFVRDDLGPRIDASWAEPIGASFETMEQAGYEVFELTGEEREKFLDAATEAGWQTVSPDIDAELVTELRQLLQQ